MHTRRMEKRKLTTLSAPRCEIIIQLPQWHKINPRSLVVHFIRIERKNLFLRLIHQWKLQCAGCTECIAPNRIASLSTASDWMHSCCWLRGFFCQWANMQPLLPSARAWWISTLMAFAYTLAAWNMCTGREHHFVHCNSISALIHDAATNLRHLRGYLQITEPPLKYWWPPQPQIYWNIDNLTCLHVSISDYLNCNNTT